MADHASALKRQRQNLKRRARNKAVMSTIKTLCKKVLQAKAKADIAPILREAVSSIAKAAQKKTLHRNNANRKISQLMKHAGSLGA